jgi:PAS domain S-box-containing protein
LDPELSLLRAVWERAVDAMALSDADGIVLSVNPAYCRLYGFTADQLIGRTFAVIFPEEARPEAEAQYRDIFQRGEDSNHEAHVGSAEGVDLIVEARASFIEHEGQRVAMLSTIRDITAQRRAEDQRDAVVASASHDLRQPLTLIKGRAEMLLRKLDDELTVTDLTTGLGSIASSVDHVSEQLASLVDAVRPGAAQAAPIEPRPMELTRWLRHIVDTHQASSGRHTFRIELSGEPLIASIDEVRMRRVMNNLLSNAVKYSPAGGEIVVRAIGVESVADDDRIIIEVEDRGVGVPSADLPHIFEAGHRASNVISSVPGSGLGLASSLAIVHDHGGQLAVDSDEGVGTTVRVLLPRAPIRLQSA